MTGVGDQRPPRSSPSASPSLGEVLLALWELSRPRVWMVSAFPVYVGYVLASRTLFPGMDAWARFWSRATTKGASFERFLATLETSWLQSQDLLVGLVVMGPLLWTATLLINDVYDLESDRANPRKASSPLVRGIVSRGLAHQAAYVFAGLSLVVSVFVNFWFVALTLGCLVLAWLYSVPPVRLKGRPGADVAVNAIGVGALAGMAGWSIGRPLTAFPFAFLPQGLLVAAAVYVPTTLVDRPVDEEIGDLTIAVHLGHEQAYQVGWWAWVASNVGALLLSWQGWIIPRRMLPVLAVFVPLLLWEYHMFIGKARDRKAMVKGVFLTSLTFLAVNTIFALMYTGLWI